MGAKRDAASVVTIDQSDWSPGVLPKVTRAEELLYSTDLAPIVREVGTSFTAMRRALCALSVFVNEAREHRHEQSGDGTAATDPDHVQRWQRAFDVLAPVHDTLMEAYPKVAEIGMAAGRAERAAADSERVALTR